jgi:cytochrome P450
VSQPTAVALDQVDLTDLDAFARNEGWAMFDTLRAEDPVHWNPEAPPNSGFWAVTKYEDIWTVDRDPETFTSTQYVNLEEVDDDLMDLRRSMLETDGPRHRALRKLIQREFSPGPLARNYENFLRDLTNVTIDNALQNSEFDFVEKVSADFPINVLVRLLDVPVSDTGMLINWGNQMVANTDPDYTEHLITDPDSDQYRHLPFRSPAALE